MSNVIFPVAEATNNNNSSQSAPRHRVIWGECIAVMAAMLAGSIAAIITDPPYGVLPVGWDKQLGQGRGIQAWHEAWANEAFRVLAEGGYLIAFSAARTMHNLASALEAVGFEIRDLTDWEYGQGQGKTEHPTTLKPAHEPIIVARKPVTAATKKARKRDGLPQLGTLGLDRVQVIASASVTDPNADLETIALTGLDGSTRMMANKVITHEPGCEMVRREVHLKGRDRVCGEADGERTGVMELWRCVDGCVYQTKNEADPEFARTATKKPVAQGPARYFLSLPGQALDAIPPMYRAKPNAAETDAGCEHLPLQLMERGSGMLGKREVWRHNPHQTKKPISVMDMLCRLFIPAGGTVLDPFGGSGSTACAVALANKQDPTLDWRSISVELDTEGKFFPVVAHERICHWGDTDDVSLEFHSSRTDVTRGRMEPQPKTASPKKAKATSGTVEEAAPSATPETARKARAKGATESSRKPKTAASRSRSRTGARASAGQAATRRPNTTPVKKRETAAAAKRTAKTPTNPPASPSRRRTAPPAAPRPPAGGNPQRQWDGYFRAIADAVAKVPVPAGLPDRPVLGLIVFGLETNQVLKL